MDGLEAKNQITQLIGIDLKPLAEQLKVTFKKEDGKINKGLGHGSTSRAFYGRKEFLKRILAIK